LTTTDKLIMAYILGDLAVQAVKSNFPIIDTRVVRHNPTVETTLSDFTLTFQ